jgi:hypothetical protein
MDQCTFGAGPLRGARGETVSKRPAKESERSGICPFSLAPLTLNVDPDFGAARADTNFADYHRELRANVHRSNEFIRRAQPGSVFSRGPKPVESSSQQILALASEPRSPSACRLYPALKRTSAGETPFAGAAISHSRRWP